VMRGAGALVAQLVTTGQSPPTGSADAASICPMSITTLCRRRPTPPRIRPRSTADTVAVGPVAYASPRLLRHGSALGVVRSDAVAAADDLAAEVLGAGDGPAGEASEPDSGPMVPVRSNGLLAAGVADAGGAGEGRNDAGELSRPRTAAARGDAAGSHAGACSSLFSGVKRATAGAAAARVEVPSIGAPSDSLQC